MKKPWLIQRLNRPFVGDTILGQDNPFAFGGGYRNGGLSGEAMDLLRPVFAFDYMGAAEFEFGAVPEALSKIADRAREETLIAWSFTIPYADVVPHWQDESDPPEGDATIYVISSVDDISDIEEFVRHIATDKRADYTDLKEPTNISSSLRPYNDWHGHTQGWLELGTGFMFFTDREMWEKTAALFGEDVTEGAEEA